MNLSKMADEFIRTQQTFGPYTRAPWESQWYKNSYACSATWFAPRPHVAGGFFSPQTTLDLPPPAQLSYHLLKIGDYTAIFYCADDDTPAKLDIAAFALAMEFLCALSRILA